METVDKSHVLGVTKINIITIILGYEKCEVCNKNVICFSEINCVNLILLLCIFVKS